MASLHRATVAKSLKRPVTPRAWVPLALALFALGADVASHDVLEDVFLAVDVAVAVVLARLLVVRVLVAPGACQPFVRVSVLSHPPQSDSLLLALLLLVRLLFPALLLTAPWRRWPPVRLMLLAPPWPPLVARGV